jgi:pimeloyl-ACP methyl ester carboxylesterase
LGVDIISEDINLLDDDEKNYYIHLFRSPNPDPNKENFILIHGFLSSALHFICLIPYLLKRFNIFVPDTIGMGLSARPQIRFISPKQSEDYFLNVFHVLIYDLIFSGKFNIKKQYYLCGHSLGGFFASRYMLKYPEGIKKVLLLSPAGITNYRIPGSAISRKINCSGYCLSVFCPTLLWPCRIRVQGLYNCSLCHNYIKNNYGKYLCDFSKCEVNKNPDGSKFNVDNAKVALICRKLSVLSLQYPKDLYRCAYYFFGIPPPAAFIPIEDQLLFTIYLPKIIIIFGENDWMDIDGAYRLSIRRPETFKVFTISGAPHSFALTNPKEVCEIIEQYFED